MARLGSHFKLGIIRRVYNAAPDGATTFYEALDSLQNARFSDVSEGRLVSSTTGGGYSVSFVLPDPGQSFTPKDFFELIEELLMLYERAQATGLSNEEQIRDYMRASLEPCRESFNDFTNLSRV